MQPRFPPRGTPAYFQFIQEWLIKERVDNERQWRLLREVESATTGLDPIMTIVGLGFNRGSGSGSGSGIGSTALCGCVHTISTRTVTLSGLIGSCAGYNGTWVCTNSTANYCKWSGSSIYAEFSAGPGTWVIYASSGCRITSWNGTCAGYAATGTNAGTCCPTDPVVSGIS